ncbi:hypothetical protein BAUCODRAFT_181496 [Baudoinia panamericana UAMH 10762]|uniref:UBC core domain-containing protein n=1 Tax=Baudoinia panamericana (strain UAMH 10762) TaxID=717646 RepID=M2NNC8_BAUPA|nr:uncharacterized protein BAUCODRAFT_181496 [Baudoinia panamericana UAMH 10762]EMD00741.1 hypothetical protein BAUCODRAFT_181496 [Baudoinia panamericana UAMH 10762]
MPRKQWVADLKKAQGDVLPLGVLDVRAGDDDNAFEFDFFDGSLRNPIKITAMILPDLSDYPSSHEYMLFCGDDAPPRLATAISTISGTARKAVFELLDIVSATLTSASTANDSDGDTEMPDSQQDSHNDEDLDVEDGDDVYDSDHEAFGFDGPRDSIPSVSDTNLSRPNSINRHFRARLRQDLRTAKEAGFKVGHLGGLLDGYNSFVTISIRMSKLAISDEALQAWHMASNDYLILIIQYPNGYKTNEELQSCDSLRLAPNLGIRVCTGKKYKPTLQEAIKVFTAAKKQSQRDSVPPAGPPTADEAVEFSLRDTFISRPLNGFLQERLVPILRWRATGMDWRGAESWYAEMVGTSGSKSKLDGIPDRHYVPEELPATLPGIVKADHYGGNHTEYSFPLLAMQFTLRHFVRCTDFCLVCHRQLDTEVEAIKPYVCDEPLCLYQYMTLGFGPSIEHEIITQPYVCDLLVSFCYNSANARKLREFPDGLALMVPPLDLTLYRANATQPDYGRHVPAAKPAEVNKEPKQFAAYEVGFDRDRQEVIFFNVPKECPVRRGTWIVVKEQGSDHLELHCRVDDVTFYPTIAINAPLMISPSKTSADTLTPSAPLTARSTALTPATTPKWAPASFQVYEQDFEELDRVGKCMSIIKLLDTLPNVKSMQEYLAKHKPADLKYWVGRISPAALSLLRWIIASNRACIMQVDGDSTTSQERVHGMKDYMQFRFAMGAPDKEERFLSAVRTTTERLNLQYPTIFAWHGSPLHNWHMIIREGLHYRNADHGRAYGDGVYHAKDAQTSTGYSGRYGYGGQHRDLCHWPHSVLRIESALALNELVNAPAEFQSNNPYYVVQHLDWIQTRYLFVNCKPETDQITIRDDGKLKDIYPQDPQRTPRGISDSVAIPASAIKPRKQVTSNDSRQARERFGSPMKRLKGDGWGNPIVLDDGDGDSDETDAEDVDILFDDPPEGAYSGDNQKGSQKPSQAKGTATDFEPAALDFSSLPLMPQPSYANSAATKRLMKELQSLQKVQNATPLGDLGWYIDVDKVENPYQWIVELHSFHVIDPNLPLVADMKKNAVKSIVMEVRFNKDFPFTPPYVRVIRPQFRSLAQGGGGHVVMGGAMCMQLLTNSGWSSVSSMESVLMQIRLAIASDPPARLVGGRSGDYGMAEAADGYVRACNTHGWTVPPGFKEMAYGGAIGGI